MRIDTANVVEYANDIIIGVASFDKARDGRKEAEDHFRDVIVEHGENLTKDEIQICIEEGYWEQGNYQVFLVHSL